MKIKKQYVVSATLLSADDYYDREDSLISLFFDGGRGALPDEIWIGGESYYLRSQKPIGGSKLGVSADYRAAS